MLFGSLSLIALFAVGAGSGEVAPFEFFAERME